MWCEFKNCSCKHVKPNGLCEEVSMWASCEVPDRLDPAKIPVSWLRSWAADKVLKDRERSELYKAIMKELLSGWREYWGDYEKERKELIKEKENDSK